eukprot:2618936-Rhodomonas_salina.2
MSRSQRLDDAASVPEADLWTSRREGEGRGTLCFFFLATIPTRVQIPEMNLELEGGRGFTVSSERQSEGATICPVNVYDVKDCIIRLELRDSSLEGGARNGWKEPEWASHCQSRTLAETALAGHPVAGPIHPVVAPESQTNGSENENSAKISAALARKTQERGWQTVWGVEVEPRGWGKDMVKVGRSVGDIDKRCGGTVRASRGSVP